MLGFVSEVTDNTCEVTSITDPKMQCGALVTRTRETAIAEGDYNLMTRGALRLSYLREDSKVVVGDTVETSGRGGVFPKRASSSARWKACSRRKAACRTTRSSSRLSAWTAFPRFPSSPNTRTQRSKPCREKHISIPKLIAYVLFSVIIFALQTGTFGGMRIFGSAVDLLPALVTAAALLGGPAEAAVVGLTVGICYDLSFTGVDGLYPLFFSCCSAMPPESSARDCSPAITFPCSSLRRLSVCCSVCCGIFFSLMHAGASFLIVLRQLAVGTVLTCLFCFIVYLPLRRLSGKSRKRSR